MTDSTTPQDGKAMPPASSGSVAGEPAAWAVLTADGKGVLHTSCAKQGSVGWKRAMERQGEVVPLYRSPTLTDAERKAIEKLLRLLREDYFAGRSYQSVELAAVIDGLLDRIG